MEKKQNPLFVGTLAKGLRLLRAFDESHVSLSLAELVARTGLEKSAVQRMAHTLHHEGMLSVIPAHAATGQAMRGSNWPTPIIGPIR